MSKCLICAHPEANNGEFHSQCLRKFYGSDVVPELDYNLDELTELAKKAVHQRVTIPGVPGILIFCRPVLTKYYLRHLNLH